MSDILASDSVNDILIDVVLVCVATERGTSQLDLGMWQNFDTRDELVGDNVTGIVRDGGLVWDCEGQPGPSLCIRAEVKRI